MKRALWLIITVVSLSSLILASCTPAATPIPTQQEEIEQPQGFDWKKFAGTTITFSYDEHAYSEAIVTHLSEFEALTGIKVKAELLPDSAYWDKLNIVLSSRSGEWDVVGTGIEPMWDQAKPGYLEPLDN